MLQRNHSAWSSLLAIAACGVLLAATARDARGQAGGPGGDGPQPNANPIPWFKYSTSAQPSMRRATSAAFDHHHNRALFFGGLTGSNAVLGDTWTFDGSQWLEHPAVVSPPPRWGHQLVADTRRGRIVMFGGRATSPSVLSNQTWEWDGAAWHRAYTAHAPSPRAFHSMTFDERRGVVVLYGAEGGSNAVGGDETWEYDGTDWMRATTATQPPGLESPALVYDRGRGVVLMFGGWDGGPPGAMHDATWEYDGTDWRRVATLQAPSPRYQSSVVFENLRGRAVLYGGSDGIEALTDTWEFDGVDWTLVATRGPIRSTQAGMVHDPRRQLSYYFGGIDPTGISDETWIHDGRLTALAAPYGTGCPTSSGIPRLVPTSRPVQGSNYGLSVENLPPGVGTVLIAHGYFNDVWALGPLPFDLGLVGYLGCALQVSTENLQLLAVTGQRAAQSLAIPSSPLFKGFPLYSQVMVADPAAPNGRGGVSNAVHAVVGA